MRWFDFMTLAVVLGLTVIQTIRGSKAGGMGLPVFDALGLVLVAVGSTHLSGPVAETLRVHKGGVMLVMFLLLGIGAFVIGRALFNATNWSTQSSMDGLLSFVAGLAAGWTVAHMVLRVIIEYQGGTGPVASMMVNAPVAREVFEFRTWNIIVQKLFNANLGPRIDPDVG